MYPTVKDRARKCGSVAKRTLQERVRKSALLLDVQVPNWYKMIDTQRFNMGKPSECVCGYIERNMEYTAFRQTGLDCLDIGRGFYYQGRSDQLESIWLHQIKKRKAVDAIYRS